MEKGRRNHSWFLLLIFIFLLTKPTYSDANTFEKEEDTGVTPIGQVKDETDEEDHPSATVERSELEPEEDTKKPVLRTSQSELFKEIIKEGYQKLKNNENKSIIIMCTVIPVAFFIALIVIICVTRKKQEKEKVVAMEEGKILQKILGKIKNKPSTTE